MTWDTFGVTYAAFLAACRRAAGFDNKSEFARKQLKLKRVSHYIGTETGKRKPGRELLEAAALAAGFTFEDCIQLPIPEERNEELRRIIKNFTEALDDPLRESAAKLAVINLMTLKASVAPTVGRGRKPKK